MTSKFVATTLLDVYRDNSGLPGSGAFDGYDDNPESTTPVATRLPSHLHMKTRNALDPVTGRTSTIESWTGRMRPGADVRQDDRLREPRTGRWFIVNGVDIPAGGTGANDVTLTLTRIAR